MQMVKKSLILPIKTVLGTYFYETNRNEVVSVSRELYDYIERVQSGEPYDDEVIDDSIKEQFDMLQSCGYLAQPQVEEVVHPASFQLDNLMSRGVNKLTLQVTQNCNLRCQYCIYSENSNLYQRVHSKNAMTLETAKKAILFYRQHAKDNKRISIGFYGGEPLLEFPLIVNAVAYAKEVFSGRHISFHITTNATLISDEIIDFLIENDFSLTFSIDGPKNVQDRNRVFPNGNGSYDVVIGNIKKMYQKSPDLVKRASISMVISQNQCYKELLELFDEPVLQGVKLIYSMVEEDGQTKRPSEQYIQDFNYDNFIALADYYRNGCCETNNQLMAESVNVMAEDIRKFRSVSLASIAAPGGPCIPGKLKLFVDCFGRFFPCEKVNENDGMCIGSLEKGFDYDAIRKQMNVGKLAPDLCKSCWAFVLCDICVKRANDGDKLTLERRSSSCIQKKSAAYHKIMQKIVSYENGVHLRKMKHLLGEVK